MQVNKSTEDYLEAMLMIHKEKGFVRSIDVAAHLGVTKPSVSYATKHLRESNYIVMDSDGLITLTESGMKIATSIYEKHEMLTEFLIDIGVDPEIAREDACKLEHDISEQSFDALCRYTGRRREQKNK